MAKVKTRAWLEELARRAVESEDLRKEYEQNVREQQLPDEPAAPEPSSAIAERDTTTDQPHE